jgi:thymidylate synthase
MNNLDKQYTDLLQDILDNGVTKQDRTETGTLSVFGRQIRHKMSDGFPLLTTKKMPFRLIATELLWFLRGDTNIKFLVDNDCHIWDGDAYKNYTNSSELRADLSKEEFIHNIKMYPEFAERWGDLGPVYGKQWRNWTKFEDESKEHNEWYISSELIDQIANLIHDLKTNPDSRRLMVNAWNVGELDQMTLPPCHYGFQVYTRELSLEERNYSLGQGRSYRGILSGPHALPEELKRYEEIFDKETRPKQAISLMWNQRSVDTFLGLPFNIASYGLLLEIIAKEVNMVPDELIGNLGDTHLYLNHIEQAKEQIGRKLDLEERRAMVTQEMFNQIYNAGDSSTLTHSEIDQWNIPRVKTREPYPLPKLFFKYEKETYVDNYELDGFILKDYQAHPHIKAPLSN